MAENIRSFSDQDLLEKSKDLLAEEKRITLAFIEHLREIERRMLFSELGFSSLYELCVRKLGMSEGSAYRRISAMRLIRDVPSAKPDFESGKLSLSTATQLQG